MNPEIKPAVIANVVAVLVSPVLFLLYFISIEFFFSIDLLLIAPILSGVIALVVTWAVFWQAGFKSIQWFYYLLFLVQPASLWLIYVLLFSAMANI